MTEVEYAFPGLAAWVTLFVFYSVLLGLSVEKPQQHSIRTFFHLTMGKGTQLSRPSSATSYTIY